MDGAAWVTVRSPYVIQVALLPLDDSDVKLTSAFQPRKQRSHYFFELGWVQHWHNPSIQAHLLYLSQNYSRGFSQITLKKKTQCTITKVQFNANTDGFPSPG